MDPMKWTETSQHIIIWRLEKTEAGLKGLHIREITLKISIIRHQNNYIIIRVKQKPHYVNLYIKARSGDF